MKKLNLLIPALVMGAVLTGCHQYMCLAPSGTTANSKLSICHVTGNGYKLITVKASAAPAHVDHGDFLAPVGAKKDKDCIVTPPIDIDTIVVPPIVIDTVVVPPVVIDTVVVPPVVVPPVDTSDAIKNLPGDVIETVSCLVDPDQPECQL